MHLAHEIFRSRCQAHPAQDMQCCRILPGNHNNRKLMAEASHAGVFGTTGALGVAFSVLAVSNPLVLVGAAGAALAGGTYYVGKTIAEKGVMEGARHLGETASGAASSAWDVGKYVTKAAGWGARRLGRNLVESLWG